MSFKVLFHLELCWPFCSVDIRVKSYEIWTSGSGGDVVKRYFLSGALAALLFSEAEPLVHVS